MTEHDSDIEFDFFDEPETEEATERVRTPRRPTARRAARRPVRPPQGLIPMLRLAGLIAFVILVIVLIVVGVRGCAIERQARQVRGVHQGRSRHREALGSDRRNDLNTALSATGIKETDLEGKITSLAAQEQQEVAQAVKLNPPGPLRVEHDH